ncbi:MAG TPA: TonB-dependent receptor, partial [Gammaproteobacteria bacterium]
GDIVGYLKWDPSADHGLMLAASGSDSELGDRLLPRYEHSAPSEPRDRTDGRTRRLEVGYHRRFGPGNDLLMHASRLDLELDQRSVLELCTPGVTAVCDQFNPPPQDWEQWADLALEQPYTPLQGAWLRRHDAHGLVLGAAWYDGEQELLAAFDNLVGPPYNQVLPVVVTPPGRERDRRSLSLWLHDLWRPRPGLLVHAGLHYESMDNRDVDLQRGLAATQLRDAEVDVDALAPRLGLAWQVTAQDTLRVAAFRALLPYLSDRLDPADVAGIPVHRNGSAGALTDELQLAWERSWSRGFAAVVAWAFEREREKEIEGVGTEKDEIDGHGAQLTGELLLGHGVGLALHYAYRDYNDDPESDLSRADQLATARLTWVDPRGFGARLEQVWRHIDFDTARATEELWSTDVELSYEFPGKRGRVALEVENLFDEQFDWFTDPFDTDGRIPARQARLVLTLNL